MSEATFRPLQVPDHKLVSDWRGGYEEELLPALRQIVDEPAFLDGVIEYIQNHGCTHNQREALLVGCERALGRAGMKNVKVTKIKHNKTGKVVEVDEDDY